MMWHSLSSIQYWSLLIICNYLYQFCYYSYLIKVGLGLGQEAKSSFASRYLIYVARVVQKLGMCKRNSFTKSIRYI